MEKRYAGERYPLEKSRLAKVMVSVMWIKLGYDFLNLDHVVRARFTRTWKNGLEEMVAELEGFVKGDLQVFARYRGPDADVLQTYFVKEAREEQRVGASETTSGTQALTGTLHDLKLP